MRRNCLGSKPERSAPPLFRSGRLASSHAQRGAPLPLPRACSQRCRRRRPPPVEANAAAAVAVADPYSDAQPASSFVWQVSSCAVQQMALCCTCKVPSQASTRAIKRGIPAVESALASPPAPAHACTHPAPCRPLSQGAKLLPLLVSVLPGLVLRLLVPAPAAISTQGWNLLCLFVSTIAGAPMNTFATCCVRFCVAADMSG